MTLGLAMALVIGLMVVFANLPFVTERILGVLPWPAGRGAKPFGVRILELLVGYAVVMALGFAFEARLGNRFEQGWEFYAITLTLFLVCAYPGFVWRYLRRGRRTAGAASTQAAAAPPPKQRDPEQDAQPAQRDLERGRGG